MLEKDLHNICSQIMEANGTSIFWALRSILVMINKRPEDKVNFSLNIILQITV